MSSFIRLSFILFCVLPIVSISAQISPNNCAPGTTFTDFENYTEDVSGSDAGSAELMGSCVTATWVHDGADRGEEYGKWIRFKTSNGDDITLTTTFSEPLVNPVVYINEIEANNTVTIKDCSGTVIASQTLIDGGLLADGTGWTGTSPTGQTSGSIELIGTYGCIEVSIVNQGTDDGIAIEFGSCVEEAVADPAPVYVAPVACLPNHLIYTVNHANETSGTLHGGINVTTEITGTRGGTLEPEGISAIGPVDPNTPTDIVSGGLLRFRKTDDGDDFSVKYTFSAPVRNSFIYIGTTGPETATVYKIFELDGTTPIPVSLIDGQPGFIASGNQIGTNKNNVEGYVQIQDNTNRLGFVIQVINSVTPPCFVGTADPDEGGDDAFRIAVGACRPDEMSIGNAAASIDNDLILTSTPFDIAITGLTNMKEEVNGQTDFGLNIYLYPSGTGPDDFDYPPSNAITLEESEALPFGESITVPVLIGHLAPEDLTNNCTEGVLTNVLIPSGFPMENFTTVITLDEMPNGYPMTSFVLPMVNVETVPTMGEWGLINLGLILMIFGMVSIRENKFIPTQV